MNRIKTFILTACLTAASFIGFAPKAEAAMIPCTTSPTLISGGSGATSLSCAPLDAGAGNTIGLLSFYVASDYLNGPVGTTTGVNIQTVYTPDGSGTPLGPDTTVVSGGFTSSSATLNGNPVTLTPWFAGSMLVNSQTMAGFNVAAVASLMPGSGAVSASTVNAWVDFTPVPNQSGVPEPGTWALMAMGLAAVGFGQRRHFARG